MDNTSAALANSPRLGTGSTPSREDYGSLRYQGRDRIIWIHNCLKTLRRRRSRSRGWRSTGVRGVNVLQTSKARRSVMLSCGVGEAGYLGQDDLR